MQDDGLMKASKLPLLLGNFSSENIFNKYHFDDITNYVLGISIYQNNFSGIKANFKHLNLNMSPISKDILVMLPIVNKWNKLWLKLKLIWVQLIQ